MNEPINDFIEPEILKELAAFEVFAKRMGFKRIEGAIYGLLTLAQRPLTSEEIEATLSLSQSAVSMALKTLNNYGMVETRGDQRERRIKLHSARNDALAIVATIFRKREQEAIQDFKMVAKRVLNNISSQDNNRYQRIRSIVITCEMAESVMNFVMKVASKNITAQHSEIASKLPKMLEAILLSEKLEAGGQLAYDITTNFASKLKEGFFKFKGEHYHEQ
jgi:DNA-binding transcriptional regulator GbsR (MarR family)